MKQFAPRALSFAMKKLTIEQFTLVDSLLSNTIGFCGLVLRIFRRLGPQRCPKTRGKLFKEGFYPILDHYYEPMFNPKYLRHPVSEERSLPGLSLNLKEQCSFLDQLNHSEELIQLELEKEASESSDFYIHNGMFCSGDAEFLYQFLRHIKPKQLLEVGSGQSTKLARMALLKNAEETGECGKHICIEPYEAPDLEGLGVEVVRQRVETCTLDIFESLNSGDVLFIDSSHMIRPQGDVLFLYQNVLPRLKKGVYVHIHDIFTPRDYLKEWIVDDAKFWNEQYLVEVMLSYSSRYKILAALNYIKHNAYDKLLSVCPYLKPEREPGSLYLEVI